jgi:phosphoenolpyruvate phosphomutase
VFREHHISLVIWANHMVRTTIAAMQASAAEIYRSQSLVDIEGTVASVSEVFRLQGADELLEAEKRYTGSDRPDTSAIILAASRGNGLDDLTRDRPKVMIPVAGKTVLRRLVDKLKSHGVNQITVVGGYRSEAIEAGGTSLVVNPDWAQGNELSSLVMALEAMRGDVVLLYGDLLFRGYILANLMDWDAEFLAVVDSSPLDSVVGNTNDLAYCSAPDDRAMYQQKVLLEHVGREADWQDRSPDGRWIGMLRVRGAMLDRMLETIEAMQAEPDFETLGIPDLLNRMTGAGHAPQVQYVSGHWMDINNLEDLQRASEFAHGHS